MSNFALPGVIRPGDALQATRVLRRARPLAKTAGAVRITGRIDERPYQRQAGDMAGSAIKRVTVNLPAKLLAEAEQVSGRGITETIVLGLEQLARRRAYTKAIALKGKLRLAVNLDLSRERPVR
jgi:hypothetical protein